MRVFCTFAVPNARSAVAAARIHPYAWCSALNITEALWSRRPEWWIWQRPLRVWVSASHPLDPATLSFYRYQRRCSRRSNTDASLYWLFHSQCLQAMASFVPSRIVVLSFEAVFIWSEPLTVAASYQQRETPGTCPASCHSGRRFRLCIATLKSRPITLNVATTGVSI